MTALSPLDALRARRLAAALAEAAEAAMSFGRAAYVKKSVVDPSEFVVEVGGRVPHRVAKVTPAGALTPGCDAPPAIWAAALALFETPQN